MVRLENVGDVLFQALLLDDIVIIDRKIYMKLYSIYNTKNIDMSEGEWRYG